MLGLERQGQGHYCLPVSFSKQQKLAGSLWGAKALDLHLNLSAEMVSCHESVEGPDGGKVLVQNFPHFLSSLLQPFLTPTTTILPTRLSILGDTQNKEDHTYIIWWWILSGFRIIYLYYWFSPSHRNSRWITQYKSILSIRWGIQYAM